MFENIHKILPFNHFRSSPHQKNSQNQQFPPSKNVKNGTLPKKVGRKFPPFKASKNPKFHIFTHQRLTLKSFVAKGAVDRGPPLQQHMRKRSAGVFFAIYNLYDMAVISVCYINVHYNIIFAYIRHRVRHFFSLLVFMFTSDIFVT